MNATTIDRAIASAAIGRVNVTMLVGATVSEAVRHCYCLECLDRPFARELQEAGRLLDFGTSSLPCEACG